MTAQPAAAGTGRRSAASHLPFVIALVVGIVIRVVVFSAYRPMILFYDSVGYLARAEHPTISPLRPIGYSLLLYPFRQAFPSTLVPIGIFQDLLALVVVVLCYAFLLRRGLPAWGATLATLPLLFDPLQLVLEHYVLSDVAFEALLVGGCLLLLWNHRPSTTAAGLAGAAIGVSALVRGAGTFLLVVFLLALVCLRPGWKKVVAFVVGGVLPLGLYATAYHHAHGVYALSQGGPRFVYARVAPIVRCHNPALQLPSYEKMLCPRNPVGHRPSSDYFMWGGKKGPAYHVQPPPGMTVEQVLKDFSKLVIRAQPIDYTRITLTGFARGFAPLRTSDVPGFPSYYWLFEDHYWMRPAGWRPTADPGPASFMTHYRKVLWTPGPLLAALLVVAAGASLGLGRTRRSGDRVAIGLLTGACLMTLLTGVAVSGFSWRYQLPQLSLVPMAGALAIAAFVRGPAPGRPGPPPPLRPLDRVSEWLGHRVPALGRLHETGALPLLLAVVVSLVAFVVVAAGAVVSGWFVAGPGLVVGLLAGVVLLAGLVVAHRRSRAETYQHHRAEPHDPAEVSS